MPVFLTGCLLTAAILFLTAWLTGCRISAIRGRKGTAGIACVCALFGAMITVGAAAAGFTDDLLSAAVLILLIAAGWLAVKGIRRNRNEISRFAVITFAVYMIALLWITLFSRDGSSNTKVLFSMHKFGRFLRTGEVGEAGHVLLNVLMFMPLGFLLPQLCRNRLNGMLYVLAVGIWLTATVESVQYLLVIGQCDLEDVIGNTLGSAAGFGLYRLYRKIR